MSLDLPKIDSLTGIDVLQDLQSLEIRYGKILRDITSLQSLSKCLRLLRLEVCRKMENVETVIGKLTSLKILQLSRNSPLRTIAFINELPELEEFLFDGTPVDDGNIEPCLRLKRAYFENKKNFSRTYEQVHAHILSHWPF